MRPALTVLGVRGALPAPGREFLEYGGNTSCIALRWQDSLLCFDAGSGLAALTGQLAGVRRLDILISHLHIDHILGLFSLAGVPVPELHLYGGAGPEGGFAARLSAVLGPPCWPVGLQAQLHEITAGDAFLLPWAGGQRLRITTLEGCHPGGSILYRAELPEPEPCGITYALDCEMQGDLPARLAGFAKGSHVLIWDANFTGADKRPGWGHSTWQEGLEVGRAAGAGRVLMTHYARGYTDAFLRQQEALARQQNQSCIFAREGMEIRL